MLACRLRDALADEELDSERQALDEARRTAMKITVSGMAAPHAEQVWAATREYGCADG